MSNFDLTINGKKASFKMSILTFRLYGEMYGLTLDEVGPHVSEAAMFGLSDMLYCAHQTYARLNDKPMVLTQDECTEAIGELKEETLTIINEAMLDVKIMGKPLRELQEAEAPKKQAGERSISKAQKQA